MYAHGCSSDHPLICICGCAVASPPFPLEVNKEALFKARNDLYAGEIKFVKDELSVMERLQLAVPDGEAEDLLKAADGDAWECGPFAVCSMMALLRYPHARCHRADLWLACPAPRFAEGRVSHPSLPVNACPTGEPQVSAGTMMQSQYSPGIFACVSKMLI